MVPQRNRTDRIYIDISCYILYPIYTVISYVCLCVYIERFFLAHVIMEAGKSKIRGIQQQARNSSRFLCCSLQAPFLFLWEIVTLNAFI